LDGTLRLRDRAARDIRDRGEPVAHDVGAGNVDRLGLAAELLDAALQLTRVRLRLLQVLLEALLVRGRLGHLDVQRKRGLQLLLLAVRLIEPLNQLRVTGVHLCQLNATPSVCLIDDLSVHTPGGSSAT